MKILNPDHFYSPLVLHQELHPVCKKLLIEEVFL